MTPCPARRFAIAATVAPVVITSSTMTTMAPAADTAPSADTLDRTAKAGRKYEYRAVAINGVGLKSKPSEAVVAAE